MIEEGDGEGMQHVNTMRCEKMEITKIKIKVIHKSTA